SLVWGNYITGSIHGYKFHDFDLDGADSYEPPLAGVAFRLYRLDAVTQTQPFSGVTNTNYHWVLAGTAWTDVHGEFWFTDLDPGYYEVREAPELNDVNDNNIPDVDEGYIFIQTTDQETEPPGLDTDTSNSFHIQSRVEYVWSLNVVDAPMDMDGDGFITQNEEDAAVAK